MEKTGTGPTNRQNGLEKILIIVGMHRSMTSLVTQWLHSCGLQVGDDLYGVDLGNVKGHYEDKDFIQLHDYILKLNNSHWRSGSGKNYRLDEYSLLKSKAIVQVKNSLYSQWGWKDPRTCLFLDHWNRLIPQARYFIVYRHFPEVVDSLFRRSLKAEKKIEYVVEFKKFAKRVVERKSLKEKDLNVWINYNSRILEFVRTLDRDRYMLIDDRQLITESESIFNRLTNSWNFELNRTAMEAVYDSGITKKTSFASVKDLDGDLLQRATKIEEELKSLTLILHEDKV